MFIKLIKNIISKTAYKPLFQANHQSSMVLLCFNLSHISQFFLEKKKKNDNNNNKVSELHTCL